MIEHNNITNILAVMLC